MKWLKIQRSLTSALSFRVFVCVIVVLLCSVPCFGNVDEKSASSPTVLFLNPGEPVDRGKGLFWPMTGRLMEVAANTFGVEIEVLYAERDHLLMLRQAEEVSQRAELPDYIVMVNEKQAAAKMLRMFKDTSTKVLLIHNDLTSEQRQELGNEREHIKNWIGTAKTDEPRSTFRMMEALYNKLGTGEPQVIGITGSRSTPVSTERAQGVSNFIAQAGRGKQLQLMYGNWGAVDAESKAKVLLGRYPQANIIWAANYSMAQGALKAVKESGSSILVGSTAAAPPTAPSMAEQGMSVSLGSHFFIGAWAMVMLYDYHNGIDFVEYGGARQKLDHLYVITPDNSPRYYEVVYDNTDALDFSVFSKYLNPSEGGYRFSLAPLMQQK